ncbi:MAG: DNA primase DnaG [Candidatus Nanoarchaeia archaeon]|nr:DNA primase DnaG [Candidatus Nanoarchaeia archaeon]
MGKISPVSAKYIVHTTINIEGVVDRPDVIGAIFGQTEGLLGSDLELRELQRNGRIGRIEVNLEIKNGKTSGSIIIPSSLDKAETAIVGAALETIQRIGPCNAKVRVEKMEDVRISKRHYVIERAKALLKELTDTVLPDSQEITEEVAQSVRMMEIREYGTDRLPAGPAIDESEEIIIVEGRADVINLLKNGFKNAIGMNGTSIPKTILNLCTQKTVTVFVDGDRGGDLIIRELSNLTEIDFVCKASDGKEVEEITKKEIHKALRSRVTLEQAMMDISTREKTPRPLHTPKENRFFKREERFERKDFERREFKPRKPKLSPEVSTHFKSLLDNLIGTKGACILDESSNILGKVPTSEIAATIKNLPGVNAIILDGDVDEEIFDAAQKAKVKYLVAMDSKVKASGFLDVLTKKDLITEVIQ